MAMVIDDWWSGRPQRHLLPRLWLQHFTGTSWVAASADGALAGFLVAFVSPDHPELAQVHLAAVDPNLRRRGVGRGLYARLVDDMQGRGVRCVRATAWPGDRQALAFHRAIGFRVWDGPGTSPAYGTPAIMDYDADGSETTVLELWLDDTHGLPRARPDATGDTGT